jgi:hypothetical protein
LNYILSDGFEIVTVTVLALGLATIGLSFILHPQIGSLEFVSKMYVLVLVIICLVLSMAVNLTSFCPLLLTSLKLVASIRQYVFCMEIIGSAKWAWAKLNKLYTELKI